MTVLVVDDDKTTQIIHKMLVTRENLDVHVAENGMQAIEWAASGHTYDLILMDMEMPVMNGLEATKALREMGITCTIVGVTSREEEVDVEAFIKAGANKCLVKPLNIKKLKLVLEEVASNVASTSGAK
uniref:Response regulatory domain-containing protein n=1 Tax=Kalanchoe fedtschenkoi TaxID=63787 RepID=A0A7N0VAI8_KALFE